MFILCKSKYVSGSTVCPRSSDQFNIVSYYIKWGTTSSTDCMVNYTNKISKAHKFIAFKTQLCKLSCKKRYW